MKVLLFARYREAAGSDSIEVRVPQDTTLEGVWNVVREQVPALCGEHAPLMALDRSYARGDHRVEGGQEVAFFPPVSGG